MPVLVNNNEYEGEQSMPRAPSTQSYAPGYFTNLLNEGNRSFEQRSPIPLHSTQPRLPQHRPSEYRPVLALPGLDTSFTTLPAQKPIPLIETVPERTMIPPMPVTTTMASHWYMGPTTSMATMPTMAPMTSLPPLRRMRPLSPITIVAPIAATSTRPNMKDRTRDRTGLPPATSKPATASVVDGHHPKPDGAYYPPTKRVKREPTDTPRKPSWAISSESDNASVISLPRPPLQEEVNSRPQPPAEERKQTNSSGGQKCTDPSCSSCSSCSSSSSSHSTFSTSGSPQRQQQQPFPMQDPPAPIIPTPLEPFPEAGTLMNFPLPQIDHQGQRPAAADGYFSALEDDILYQTRDPYEIEIAYRDALRVRERVDWDCRRLGLRLRYLRRCQARLAERSRQARECEWERSDFCGQTGRR
ncbi:hypothetical protein PMG11_01650 [Penicillium brasilianum]|uniref:Uncharacterized protein n=1 Tax=Penicillium brasilianum TaxID=104259 RepID=A0A0F7TK41_PENBI|nr:hypothetical protein PMG11_01650 [Penicillium brasilianum]